MKKLNKKNIIKKLYEQLVGAGNTAGTQLTGNNLRQFLQNIQQPNQKYIKVLSFNRESIYPETFDVKNEFGFQPNNDSSIRIEAQFRNDEIEHETTVENWINDLNAIENADNNGLNLQIKLYFSNNGNNLFSCSVIYEDRTNVVFIIKDLANTGKSFDNVRTFIQNISNIAQRLNIELDSHSIINAMPDIIENAIDTDDEGVFKLMVSLLRPDTAQPFIEQFTNLTNQQNNVEPNNQQNTNQQVNEPEVIEPEIVNPDNQQNNQQDTEPEVVEPENTDPENTEPEDSQENQTEDCNGMRLIEEIQHTDIAQNWNGEDFAIAFGGESFENFKRTLRQFPRNAVQSLTNKPVKYCQVDFGNPAGAKKAYLDVYRNFKFYIFETKNDIRWYQANKGHAAFFKLTSGRTPNDMYNMLKSGTSGLYFVGFFYGRIRGEIRKGSTAIQTLWTSSEKFKQMTTTASTTPKTNSTKTQTSNKNKSPEEKRREYIVSVIKQRIMDEIVGKPNWYVYKPITKNSDRSVNLVGGKTYIKYGQQRFCKHTITQKDAEILAQHFDDWHWLGHPANARARDMQNTLNRIMNPAGLEPPPEQEEIQLDPAEQEKLDRTIDAVNDKLEDTGIEIQITVPGHKPRYKWVMNHASEQAQGWNVNNRYFAVMFAGLDPQKLYDNEAQQFLVDMDIWRIVQNAFAEARREYPDIKLAVALDNGL